MKKLLIIFLLSWSSVAFANDAEFERGVDVFEAGNHKEAFAIWKPLAEDGIAEAQFNIALMYFNGKGISQNYNEAAKWYKEAAERGDPNAQYNLALMHDKGQGVLRDYKESVKWYRKAAEQGDAKAQHNLGIRYAKGEGVPINNIYAYMWINIAKANGNERAQESIEAISKRLTPASLENAQRLSSRCFNSNYTECE